MHVTLQSSTISEYFKISMVCKSNDPHKYHTIKHLSLSTNSS